MGRRGGQIHSYFDHNLFEAMLGQPQTFVIISVPGYVFGRGLRRCGAACEPVDGEDKINIIIFLHNYFNLVTQTSKLKQ